MAAEGATLVAPATAVEPACRPGMTHSACHGGAAPVTCRRRDGSVSARLFLSQSLDRKAIRANHAGWHGCCLLDGRQDEGPRGTQAAPVRPLCRLVTHLRHAIGNKGDAVSGPLPEAPRCSALPLETTGEIPSIVRGADIAQIAGAIVQSTPRVMVWSGPPFSTSRVCGPVVDFVSYCITLFHSSKRRR
jgi:hypothetical protein